MCGFLLAVVTFSTEYGNIRNGITGYWPRLTGGHAEERDRVRMARALAAWAW